jgi:gluconolactonase
MTHEAVRPEFRQLVDEHAEVRRIGTGFTFTEGPIWHLLRHAR